MAYLCPYLEYFMLNPSKDVKTEAQHIQKIRYAGSCHAFLLKADIHNPLCFLLIQETILMFAHPTKGSGGAWSVRTMDASIGAKVTELILPNLEWSHNR